MILAKVGKIGQCQTFLRIHASSAENDGGLFLASSGADDDASFDVSLNLLKEIKITIPNS